MEASELYEKVALSETVQSDLTASCLGDLGTWTVLDIDNAAMAILLFHMFVICCWCSWPATWWLPSEGVVAVLISLFCFVYPVELCVRVQTYGSVRAFWDHQSRDVRFANRMGTFVVAASCFSALLYLAEAPWNNVWRCLMSLQLLRILVLQETFRAKMYCLVFATKPLYIYTLLMGVCFVEYSLIGLLAYKGLILTSEVP